MAKQRVKLTFPKELVTQPLIHNLSKEFNLVTNIRRADVTGEEGWVVLELDGKIEDIEKALIFAKSQGVMVDPVEGDVVAG